MIIYKLLRIAEWQQLEAETETLGAPIDLLDGYIHFSTKEQVKETASKHFAGVAAHCSFWPATAPQWAAI